MSPRAPALILLASLACDGAPTAAEALTTSVAGQAALPVQRSEPILPLPAPARLDAARVELGARLFASPLLSEDGRVSCASCHLERHGWADGAAHSRVPGRPPTELNVPALSNLQYYHFFSWSGAYDDLGAHADALIQNPDLMGTTWEAAAARLERAAGWRERFERAFARGLTAGNVREALLEFERSLTLLGSPFDHWLQGDAGAISTQAQRGYRLFESRGCISCHQGALLGGNLFQRLGVMLTPPAAGSAGSGPSTAALGRFLVTGREEDRYALRVPSLRNIALTAPYLHDGSAPTLAEVVDIMAEYQLGKLLSPDERESIVQFLLSLTGRPAEGP
jgi:cytochrome c peroxidase